MARKGEVGMMPTLPQNREFFGPYPAINAGFTLIEMLMVLAILSLAGLVFVQNFNPPIRQEQALSHAALHEAIVNAKSHAMSSGGKVTLSLQPYGYDFARYDGATTDQLIFYPDGSAIGGDIMDDGRAVAHIRWIDGAVRDE